MYVGKFVFLQRVFDPSENGHSYYNDGEYLIIRETPNVLYGVKPKVGYDFKDLRSFPLVGSQRFEVISCHESKRDVLDLATANLEWAAEALKPGGKRIWIESVYTDCQDIAKSLLRTLGIELPPPVEVKIPQKTVVEIEVRVNGVPLTLKA